MSGKSDFAKKNKFISFACSAQGASHLSSGTVCQDYSLVTVGGRYILAAVCDGHGGADYVRSDRGSKFAAQAVGECVSDKELLDSLARSRSPRDTERILHRLKQSIIGSWLELIWADYEQSPLSGAELEAVSERAREAYLKGQIEPVYGSTMLFSVITSDFCLAMQLGDGTCAVFSSDGNVSYPMPTDERCCLNITTSMCDSDAVNEMRHFIRRDIPASVFLSTDGVENSFSDKEALGNFYSTIAKAFFNGEINSAKEQLREYLPRLSEKGSGDDVSVAFILKDTPNK